MIDPCAMLRARLRAAPLGLPETLIEAIISTAIRWAASVEDLTLRERCRDRCGGRGNGAGGVCDDCPVEQTRVFRQEGM